MPNPRCCAVFLHVEIYDLATLWLWNGKCIQRCLQAAHEGPNASLERIPVMLQHILHV